MSPDEALLTGTLRGMYVRAVSSTTGDPEQAAPPGPAAPAGSEDDALAGIRERVRAFRELLARPLTPYYLIVGITALLLCLGLVMVLSAGSYRDLTFNKSPYSDFVK